MDKTKTNKGKNETKERNEKKVGMKTWKKTKRMNYREETEMEKQNERKEKNNTYTYTSRLTKEE